MELYSLTIKWIWANIKPKSEKKKSNLEPPIAALFDLSRDKGDQWFKSVSPSKQGQDERGGPELRWSYAPGLNDIFTRPGVAGAVLQTPLLLINSVIN